MTANELRISAADPVAEFASSLRRLRLEAGNPTYQSMEHRSGRSRASLNGASKGRKFPTWEVTRDFVAVCGGDVTEWRQRWVIARDAQARIPQEDDVRPSPYRGLEPYGGDDAHLFFGRKRLVTELTELTTRARFTVVLGASGSGKSSLLRAGLIPRLRRTKAGAARPSVIRTLKPGAAPLTENRALLRPAERPGDTYLIVDQFEELFTVCQSPAEREGFIDALLTARAGDSRLRVVVALRSDFFGHVTRHVGLVQAYQESHVLVGPMNREELREAVTKPVAARGLNVQQTLTERVVSEVEDDPAALPLLSYALDQAWRYRKGHLLDERAYDAAGGLHGAIAQQAEKTYATFTADEALHARRVLLRLVAPGEDGPDTRRRVRHTELHASLDEEGVRETRTVVEALVAARLLILDEDDEVDLAHEALLTSWPRLREWTDAEHERLRVHRRLVDAAQEWDSLDRDPDALYRGSRLDTAQEVFPDTERPAQLTPLEGDFLAASELQRSSRARWRRGVICALAALALIATGTAGIAWQQRSTARAERNSAVFQQTLSQADLVRDHNRPLAARLDVAARALDTDPGLETRLTNDAGAVLGSPLRGHRGVVAATAFAPDGDLLASAGHDGTVRLWDTRDPRRVRAPGAPLTGFSAAPESLAFAPRGDLLTIGLRNGQVMRYDVADPGRPRAVGDPLPAHDGAVGAVRVSPDGRRMATAGDDGVRVWDLTTPTRPTPHGPALTGHDGAVHALDFGPDGDTLVSGGHDRTLRLWDLRNPDRVRQLGTPLRGHTQPVFSIAWSGDGRTVASSGFDQTVRLWNVENPRKAHPRGQDGGVPVLTGHDAHVLSVAFSPDSNTLLSASEDNRLRLWNVRNPDYGKALGDPVTGHTGAVWSAAFRPDDPLTFASSGDDGEVILWQRPRSVLSDLNNPALATAISPDGAVLAVGSEADAAIRLYDVRNPARPRRLVNGLLAGEGDKGHTGPVRSLAFSPDSHTLISGSDDGTTRLWNISLRAGGQLLHTLETGQPVLAVGFSPDGRTLATGGAEQRVRLWRLRPQATPAAAGTLRVDHDVRSLSWHADNRVLATAHSDGGIRLWDTHTRSTVRRLNAGFERVTSIAFSPDGGILASGGADRTVRLWNTKTPRRAEAGAVLTGHRQQVHDVAFSADGSTLASGSGDKAIRLWDVSSSHRAAAHGQPLTGHTDSVVALGFTHDGQTLASVGYDLTARLWSLDPERAERDVCDRARNFLTEELWKERVPGVRYRPGCGE